MCEVSWIPDKALQSVMTWLAVGVITAVYSVSCQQKGLYGVEGKGLG